MSLLYADSSALVRAYLPDEPEHVHLRQLLLESDEAVITSELSRLELASAIGAAARAGRLLAYHPILDRFDGHCAEGVLALIDLDRNRVLPRARALILEHGLRTLDAIHLAVAVDDAAAYADGELVLVTRDREQAAAARALGLEVL